MRLKIDKTASQKELAIHLEAHEPAAGGILNRERRRLLIDAAKTALAAALCWWLAARFGLHEGYWGAISAIIVLQSNFGATVTASRDRLLGTLIGAAIGFTFSLVGPLPWNYILAVLIAVIVCSLLGLRNSSRLAGVTITIVMLVGNGASHWTIALERVGQVLLGIVVAIAVSTLILPDRAGIRLRDGLAQEFLVLGAFFEAILAGFRGPAAENLLALREEALAMLRGNNQLLEASQNEPAAGPGWREGMSMLAHFGRYVFDALVALELAVQGSHNDAYAQLLEPDIGGLAADIRTAFHFVATCIHRWRFHLPPKGFNLEDDIARLEARMAQVRHTGATFSQEEILRAYAVLLHLKQIARLLRTTRIETARAVGKIEVQPE